MKNMVYPDGTGYLSIGGRRVHIDNGLVVTLMAGGVQFFRLSGDRVVVANHADPEAARKELVTLKGHKKMPTRVGVFLVGFPNGSSREVSNIRSFLADELGITSQFVYVQALKGKTIQGHTFTKIGYRTILKEDADEPAGTDRDPDPARPSTVPEQGRLFEPGLYCRRVETDQGVRETGTSQKQQRPLRFPTQSQSAWARHSRRGNNRPAA